MKYLVGYLLFVLITLNSFNAKGQTHLSGQVAINLNTGLIACDFKLINLPNVENYKVLLNKGFNIKHFKNEDNTTLHYNGYYAPFVQGEALGYHFSDSKRNKIDLPRAFEVSYVGAFPKYENEYNVFDFKGLIAINNQTLRATEQTKWYPVIYDVDADKLFNSYTYDIEVSIIGTTNTDSTSIFINGSAPKKETKSRFVSKKQVPLFLFAGNYSFIDNNGDYILNADVTSQNAELIFNNIEIIKASLSEKLKQKFTDNIYLLNHKAVNKRRAGSSWGFNVYPSFAFTGLNFNTLVKENKRFDDNNIRYFAHEFAHNYFSTNVNSGKLKWFWLESFPEYLSFSVASDLCDKEYLPKVLLFKTKRLSDKNFKPLTEIVDKDEIDDLYRYSLGPLILQCFQDTFSKEKTNKIMVSLLKKANRKSLTLKDFKEAAIESGIKKSDFESFNEKYISSKNFKSNVIDFITKKYSP
ncbi:hypothetical protein GTQ40_04345 [Flavobacteriaceae bacterium R38]|nr:hypothetical protein [Flavobacteriaceae bacterium R38]